MKLIIGLSGKIGSGKDTAARLIAEILKPYGLSVARYCFADKLKEIAELLTGYKRKILHGLPFANCIKDYTQDDKNMYLQEWGMTLGKLLQLIGTEAIRQNVHPDAWIIALLEELKHVACDIVTITDLRFRNEADALKNIGALLIRLNGDPAGIRARSNRDLNHLSEVDLDDYDKFDYIIETTPDINWLRSNLEKILFQTLKIDKQLK